MLLHFHRGDRISQQKSEGSIGRACLGRRVDSEAQLGLLAVVHREALQQEGAQAGAGASTHSIEDKEALQTCAGSLTVRIDAHVAQTCPALHASRIQPAHPVLKSDILEPTQSSVHYSGNTLSRLCIMRSLDSLVPELRAHMSRHGAAKTLCKLKGGSTPVQLSASLRMRSRQRSTISLPMV